MSPLLLLISEKNPEYVSLTQFLEQEKFNVHHLSRIQEAISFFKIQIPDIILLDISQQFVNGLEFCHLVKSNPAYRDLIIILLSGRKEEEVEVGAFNANADDFVLTPVRRQALLQRIRARAGMQKEVVTVQSEINGSTRIRIDRESFSAFVNSKPVILSKIEFELLFLLASQPGRLFKRDELFEKVWKKKSTEKNRTLDVHILRLRRKIGENTIQTQNGVGYRLVVEN